MAAKLYVKGTDIGISIEDTDLRSAFSEYGRVRLYRIIFSSIVFQPFTAIAHIGHSGVIALKKKEKAIMKTAAIANAFYIKVPMLC